MIDYHAPDQRPAPNYKPAAKPSFFESLPPKYAFIGGIVAAVLLLCTAGFIILAGCLLTGRCAGLSDKPSGDPTPIVDNDPSDSGAIVTGVPAVTADDHILGNPEAPVSLIVYSDIECPFCKRFHPTMKQVAEDYPDQVKVVFRHFPLSFHPQALPAANAAECAGEQGKFFEFLDEAFANQDQLGDDFYKTTAGKLKLNISKFNDCYAQSKYADVISADAAGGASAGVDGTPGSFVIGADNTAIPIKGALPYESVKQAIDSVL